MPHDYHTSDSGLEYNHQDGKSKRCCGFAGYGLSLRFIGHSTIEILAAATTSAEEID